MSLVLQALGCFCTSSAFDSDVGGTPITEGRDEEQRGLREMLGRRPSGMIHNGYVYSDIQGTITGNRICVCIHIVDG
ncbi:hypothetical protein DEU56DRAFT_789821, partial [Suillus clintonianus]|uniref:uncharacterized protein n=1 Tax=Suillus clintonianus TaxID=1904413 RepID=UPI001B872D96